MTKLLNSWWTIGLLMIIVIIALAVLAQFGIFENDLANPPV